MSKFRRTDLLILQQIRIVHSSVTAVILRSVWSIICVYINPFDHNIPFYRNFLGDDRAIS